LREVVEQSNRIVTEVRPATWLRLLSHEEFLCLPKKSWQEQERDSEVYEERVK